MTFKWGCTSKVYVFLSSSVRATSPPSFSKGAHFLSVGFKHFRINISILFTHCSPSWLEVTFSPSALSLSPLSLYYLCKGGSHRKITIIIEDPVAGWQCSSTVLHHLTPPTPLCFFPLHANELSSSLSFQVLPSAHNMCFWCLTLLF